MQPIPPVLVGLTAVQRRGYIPLEVLMAGVIRIFMAVLIALSVAALPVQGICSMAMYSFEVTFQ